MESNNSDELCAKTIRSLCIDMVRNASSGHLGSALGMALTGHILFTKFLKIDPKKPDWVNRDRFVLSNGHSCPLLYTLLHLLGFDIPLSELKKFRRLCSKTPGHPENYKTKGVDATTGPLGQGVATAVGMAIASKHTAAKFNRQNFETLIEHKIYVFCGDGDMMEGIVYESCSLAGHLKLDNLVLIYNENKHTADGPTKLCFTEDVKARFESFGWETFRINEGDKNASEIENCIREAIQSEHKKPKLIFLNNTFGYGSYLEGNEKAHSYKIKDDKERENKPLFKVPEEVKKVYEKVAKKNGKIRKEWEGLLEKYGEIHENEWLEFKRIHLNLQVPKTIKDVFDKWSLGDFGRLNQFKKKSIRIISNEILKLYFEMVPELIGGSADLGNSCGTLIDENFFRPDNPLGKQIAFGVREHAMFGIANGLSSYGYIPLSSTFANFMMYGYPALRIGALNKHKQIIVLSHDSIALGEDGPTHQQVEVFALLRAASCIFSFRPANFGETAAAYKIAILLNEGPVVIFLSKTNLFIRLECPCSFAKTKFGAYILHESPNFAGEFEDRVEWPEKNSFPDSLMGKPLILVASGEEVGLALETAYLLENWLDGRVRVVSCPSYDFFKYQSREYKRKVFPLGALVVSIEAASFYGWSFLSHYPIYVRGFGTSGRPRMVMKAKGFDIFKVTYRCTWLIGNTAIEASKLGRSVESYLGLLPCQK